MFNKFDELSPKAALRMLLDRPQGVEV